MPERSADRISVARRPPPRADAESVAFTDSGTNCDAEPGARTARSRDLAGTVLYADSADTISDADPIDYAERRAGCIRFSGAVANGFAHTNTFAIERPVSPAFGDRIAGANPLAVSY